MMTQIIHSVAYQNLVAVNDHDQPWQIHLGIISVEYLRTGLTDHQKLGHPMLSTHSLYNQLAFFFKVISTHNLEPHPWTVKNAEQNLGNPLPATPLCAFALQSSWGFGMPPPSRRISVCAQVWSRFSFFGLVHHCPSQWNRKCRRYRPWQSSDTRKAWGTLARSPWKGDILG